MTWSLFLVSVYNVTSATIDLSMFEGSLCDSGRQPAKLGWVLIHQICAVNKFIYKSDIEGLFNMTNLLLPG